MGGNLGCHRSIPKDPMDFGRSKRKFSTACNFSDIVVNQERLNINTATEEELMTLPGVNRSVAQNIVEYRKCIEGFKKVEDLALVSGVGAAKLEIIKLEICVSNRGGSSQHSPSSSIRKDNHDHLANSGMNINTASLAQLLSIRGITERIAQNIVNYRKEYGSFECIEDLVKVNQINSYLLDEIRCRIFVERSRAASTNTNCGFACTTQSHASLTPFSLRSEDLDLPSGGPPQIISTRTNVEVFHGMCDRKAVIRVATWNLQFCSNEKANNPGVREVVCMTLLENGIKLLAVQDLVDREALDKIDKDVIPLMEDGHLAKFIPSFGDRLALVYFCRSQTPLQKKKMGLFEKLRSKLQMRKESDSSPTSTTTGQVPNIESQVPAKKRGRASHRKIEIGWLHCEGGVVKQIRAKQGGGTRTVVIGVDCGMDTVLEKGKNFFFPEGTSTKGHISDFDFEVWDYKHQPVHEDVTIGLVYETLGMARLRFYIATCPKKELQKDRITDKPEDDIEEIMVENSGNDRQKLDAYANAEMSGDHVHHEGADDFEEVVIVLQDDESLSTGMEGSSQQTQFISVTDSHAITGAHLVTGGLHTLVATVPHVFQSTDLTSDASDYEVTFGPGNEHDIDLNDTEPYDIEILHQHQPPTTSPFSVDEPQQQPPTVFCAPTEEGPQQQLPKVVTMHHGSCLDDMISGFLDPAVLTQPLIFKRLLPDNTEENGTGSGVVRDVYSAFWNEFYDRCTVGTTVKVPFIRHDFHSDIWKAVGRILLKGYQTCQYLPIKLALPFVEEILYGAVCSDLLETFKHFVSLQDQNILSKALDDFCSVDTDELLDVLENYECRKRVTAETLRDILMEIAHKELVQKPMYVIDCWKDVIQPNITLDHIELVKMYNNLRPTPKKIQGLLHFPGMMTAKQREVENHLKRYIRELDEEKLGKFLRFTTGSDVITCDRIKILFSNMSTFTRRPIGRTCGKVLELAECYENFPDFRSEFNAVFDSNIWIMDIV